MVRCRYIRQRRRQGAHVWKVGREAIALERADGHAQGLTHSNLGRDVITICLPGRLHECQQRRVHR
ncbi:hypothetical protein D3C73_1605280 [compost metagenome]